MIGDFITGFKCALSGFRYIKLRGLRRFVLIPLTINISLFIMVIWYTFDKVSSVITAMVEWLPGLLEWLSWLAWPIIFLLVLLIVFYTFTLVANFIGAPFNSFLAEKLEDILTGGIPPSTGRLSTIASIKQAFVSQVQKLGYLIAWVIPLVLLMFIPIFYPIMPIIWFLYGAWMLSLEYCDYPMGNHEIGFSGQRKILRENKYLALGFGSAVTLMTMIPFINFLAMPVSVCGATAMWVEYMKKGQMV